MPSQSSQERYDEYLEMREIDPSITVDDYVGGLLAFEADCRKGPDNIDRLVLVASRVGALVKPEITPSIPESSHSEPADTSNVVYISEFRRNRNN